jgi:hypothetical protein
MNLLSNVIKIQITHKQQLKKKSTPYSLYHVFYFIFNK